MLNYSPCLPEQPAVGEIYVFGREGGTIGREKDSEHVLRLPDMEVSKTHARIHYRKRDECFFITDLGSRNGTLLNGKRLSERWAGLSVLMCLFVLAYRCFFLLLVVQE